ncbi:MAG: T9SS type A sorting domain-containing protein [Saprospiraceae bacterium]|nr:T9SS type A sorting domain-containing protein [Saprospiraceae bacterium]
MKKLFLTTLLALMSLVVATAQTQIVYEDFEGGTSDLAWEAANGTYNGVIANPGPDAVNGSGFVGSYTKSGSHAYSLFWVQNLPPLNLTEFNQFKLKVWCATATPVLLKLEGTGPAIEKTALMPAANQWVELTFDFSAAEYYTGLTKIIIFFDPGTESSAHTYYFDDLRAVKAPQDIETFEAPSGITWTSLNGTYLGAIANPAPDAVNGSATVGAFVNNPNFDFNFAFGTRSTPLDLSTYNQFKIKMWAPKNTEMLFKLEGPGGQIEQFKNIAVANKWQEYTFDFSGAANLTQLDKILVVFSPFITGSSDTFYIDDIQALPQGPCLGATPNPDILDDFDCNRNAVYGIGWDSIHVVQNPAPSPDNNSRKVGEFRRRTGPGTEYAAFVIDNGKPIDLSERYLFGLKVWAPKTGTLLLKIEGGSGAKEVGVPVTEVNKWVEYFVDFKSEIGKGHTRLVIFFNAGVNGEPGEIYYADDIKLYAPKGINVEDFQESPLNLGWQPLNGDNVIHGNFTAPTANPSPNAVNSSSQVGCYSKGSSPLSTLQAINLTANFDLTDFPQFNLDVLSPASVAPGTKVRMQLFSPIAGNQSVEAAIATPGEWETLGFDFSPFSAVADFGEIRIIFNPDAASPGQSWCIDNLRQGIATVDPCIDVQPNPVFIDDFECQRNYVEIFYGASDLKVINNPQQTVENSSLRVGEYNDPAGAGTEFAGIGFTLPAPPDLSLNNQLEVQVWSPFDNVPFLFKIQGNGANVERWDTLPAKNKWHTFSLDFSAAQGTPGNQIVIFFNVLSPTGGGTYYVDNIRWRRKGYSGCVGDNETANTTLPNFAYFNNNPLDGQTTTIVDNPLKAGINTSNKVIRYVQSGSAPIFSGAFADLDAAIDFKGNKQIRTKVLMDHIGKFTMKVEVFGNPIPPIEITADNTKVNEWEELVFAFPTVGDNDRYNRLTVLVDIGSTGTGTDRVTYFDDIIIGDGVCGAVSTFTPTVAAMRILPNPVSDYLRVENFEGINRIDVFNIFGQRLSSVNTSGDSQTRIDVTSLPAGIYTMAGYNEQGQLIGNAKFVKQ